MSLVPTPNYLSLSIGGPLLSENVVNNKLRDHEKQEGFHLVKHDETHVVKEYPVNFFCHNTHNTVFRDKPNNSKVVFSRTFLFS